MELSIEEKKLLLNTARKSIEKAFDPDVDLPVVDYKKFPVLKSHGGAFVTLTIDSRLRGCVGYILSDSELPDTITRSAIQAAFGDSRFPELREEEVSLISIEISVLSEPFPMKDYNEIELGRHGLIIEEYGRRGLLLPQVPIEHNMDKEEYLSAICEKAGLPPDLWEQKKVNLDLFTATVFSEKELESDNETS